MNEKQIIKLLRHDQFEKLKFLSDEKLLEENENYYGFLYFLLDKKRDNTVEVLKCIELKFGSLSRAYEFLGRIATEIYSHFGEEHIALSFFAYSVELNEKNSDAWWGIYWKSNDNKAFLKSLKIDFNNKEFDKVKSHLVNFKFTPLNISNYSKEECYLLVNIIFNENIACQNECKKVLIEAYYIIEQYNEGVNIIKETDSVSLNVIEDYYNNGFITLDMAISKTYYLDLDILLKNDHGRLYIETIKKLKTKKISKSIIIMRAFRASKFLDVIQHYNDISDKNSSQHNLNDKLYYLLSQLYLNKQLDKVVLNYVIAQKEQASKKDLGLFKAFYFKYNLNILKNRLSKLKGTLNQINSAKEYSVIENLLEEKSFLNHYLYDELDSDLKVLSAKWDELYFTSRLNSILDCSKPIIYHDDVIELCHLWRSNNNYREAIQKLKHFHIENKATIASSNMLGICYESEGMFIEAFEYYNQSLNLMLESKEYDYNIFSNYLNCAKKASFQIPDIKYGELRDRFNTSLVEEFKWDTFTSENLKRLYKYSPFNLNTLDSLSNQYFYLPSKNQLNDPVELPEIKEIGAQQLIDSNYRICSFSNSENQMLMWSHYTENHQGIMVEYVFGGELPVAVGIEKVKYTNESKRKRDSKYIFNQFLLTKNDEWAYEEEVRLISYKKDKVYYETYNYPNHDRNKINAWVSCITLGLNFDESKKSLIINLIKNINIKRRDYEEKIKLKQARISKNNLFCLEYFDIEV